MAGDPRCGCWMHTFPTLRLMPLLLSVVVSLAYGFGVDEPYHHTQLLQAKTPKIVKHDRNSISVDATGDLSDKDEAKDDAIFFQAGMTAKHAKEETGDTQRPGGDNGRGVRACSDGSYAQKMEPCETEQKTEHVEKTEPVKTGTSQRNAKPSAAALFRQLRATNHSRAKDSGRIAHKLAKRLAKERADDKVSLRQAQEAKAAKGKPPAPPPKEGLLQAKAAVGKPPAPAPKEALLQAKVAAGKPPAPAPKEALLQAKAAVGKPPAPAPEEALLQATAKLPAPAPEEVLLQGKGNCIDDNTDCAYWASIGECDANPAYMHHSCRLSCGKCQGNCVDDHADCAYWARIGECDANPAYMKHSCRMSCEICQANCVDDNRDCPYWASIGECDVNPAYMHHSCKLSCEICQGDVMAEVCVDDNMHCDYWASIGECDVNPAYMLWNCKLSCSICGGQSDQVCQDVPDWKDINGIGCHGVTLDLCHHPFNQEFSNLGHSLDSACCICGGGIFEDTPSAVPVPTFKGCYKDDGERDLDYFAGSGKTIATCLAACPTYRYIGMQYYGECWCGDEFGEEERYYELPQATCGTPCNGESAAVEPVEQFCGQGWSNAVYENPTAPTEDDYDYYYYEHHGSSGAMCTSYNRFWCPFQRLVDWAATLPCAGDVCDSALDMRTCCDMEGEASTGPSTDSDIGSDSHHSDHHYSHSYYSHHPASKSASEGRLATGEPDCTKPCPLAKNWKPEDIPDYVACLSSSCCQDYDPSVIFDGLTCTQALEYIKCDEIMEGFRHLPEGTTLGNVCCETCRSQVSDGHSEADTYEWSYYSHDA